MLKRGKGVTVSGGPSILTQTAGVILPQGIEEDFTDAAMFPPESLDPVMRPVTPERVVPMKVSMGHATQISETSTNVTNSFGPFSC